MSVRRLTVALGLVLTVALALAPAAGAGKRPPSRLLVTGEEWHFTLSRARLDPGESIIQLYNRGEDPHNLRIQKQRGGAVRRIAEVEPGATGTLELRLKKGTRYRLWCSLPAHRERGMEAKLKVRRKPRSA